MAIIFFVALNTVYGLMPFVDNFMHVSGALTGFLVGNLLLIRPNAEFRCWSSSEIYDQDDMPAKRTNAIILNIVWLLSFGILFAAGVMGLYGLFSGTHKPQSQACTAILRTVGISNKMATFQFRFCRIKICIT